MNQLIRTMAIGATTALVSCASYGSGPRNLPSCSFNVGDSVTRGGIGAIVPAEGQAVSGIADGPKSSASIEITTSQDGVVTISSTKNAGRERREVCQLP
jgi:hypothetical protein